MNKYLIVGFDRYNTEESGHTFVMGKDPIDALMNDPDEDYEMEWIEEEIIHSNETFSCIPGEESDILIYKVS